jgi:hypothetical protein
VEDRLQGVYFPDVPEHGNVVGDPGVVRQFAIATMQPGKPTGMPWITRVSRA